MHKSTANPSWAFFSKTIWGALVLGLSLSLTGIAGTPPAISGRLIGQKHNSKLAQISRQPAANGLQTSHKKGKQGFHKQAGGLETPPNWKLGVALYSFHNSSFPVALAQADSAGLKYVEGYTFAKAGPELKDSLIMNLSSAGLEKVNGQIAKSGLRMESIYVLGGNTVDKWKSEFELAKKLHVKYVTAEPPMNLWDSVDSLAGVYGIKVAVHGHWKGVSAYWSPDSMLAAFKNHPNFGACPDLGHWPKSGINPVAGLRKLQGHIIAIHLKDVAAYNNPKLLDVPLGKGVINFPAVAAELKRQKYTGYLIIERDAEEKAGNLPSVTQTVAYYNKTVGLTNTK